MIDGRPVGPDLPHGGACRQRQRRNRNGKAKGPFNIRHASLPENAASGGLWLEDDNKAAACQTAPGTALRIQ